MHVQSFSFAIIHAAVAGMVAQCACILLIPISLTVLAIANDLGMMAIVLRSRRGFDICVLRIFARISEHVAGFVTK